MDDKKAIYFRNGLIGLAVLLLGGGLYQATVEDMSRVTPEQLAQRATPYEQARTNGRPTLLEFYADWCVSCKLMTPTIAKLEKQFRSKVNLVVLNVDNPKWLPELQHYQVDGIPHYVLLGADGHIKGNVIGEQTADLFAANLQALVDNKPLPYARPNPGQVSTFTAPKAPTAVQSRDHSAPS